MIIDEREPCLTSDGNNETMKISYHGSNSNETVCIYETNMM